MEVKFDFRITSKRIPAMSAMSQHAAEVQQRSERRFTTQNKPKVSKRADGKSVIEGYAAVFYRASDPGTEYDMGYGIKERIAPTAFARALREKQDVVCRVDHTDTIGRTVSGTLTIKMDEIGLFYSVELPDTQAARDAANLIERGDISGSSFCFRATQVTWIDQGETEVRLVQDCDLFDVGPVVFPAYQATSCGVRAAGDDDIEAIKAERDNYRHLKKMTDDSEADQVDMRAREVALDLDTELV